MQCRKCPELGLTTILSFVSHETWNLLRRFRVCSRVDRLNWVFVKCWLGFGAGKPGKEARAMSARIVRTSRVAGK
jgi:hypothetical protein